MTSIRARLGAASLLLATLLVTPAPAAAAEAGTAGGAAAPELLERYNARDVGAPGLRRIRLQLHNDGTLTRTFDIAHAWQLRDGSRGGDGEIRSLVLLEQPENLRGTDYLLVEGAPGGTGLEVHLHLPTSGGRVLEVLPGRFDEGLLGSDFGYTDLLWRIPLRGRRVRELGPRRIGGVETWGFEIEPVSEEAKASTTWDRTRYYLRREPALLVAAEYYRDDSGRPPATEPFKRLRVEGWKQIDGVWSPRKMVMDAGAGRTSTITLRAARFDVGPLPADLFAPATLAEMTAILRSGETPGFLDPLDGATR